MGAERARLGNSGPSGSFTLVMLKVMHSRSRKDSIISIGQLNEKLDNLQRAPPRDKKKPLMDLLQNCTAEEMMWVVKIIMKGTHVSQLGCPVMCY
jgi:hypothetical protein